MTATAQTAPPAETPSQPAPAGEPFARELEATRAFFLRTLDCFDEDDSGFAPRDGVFTVAQQVAHTASTVDWCMEGGFGAGFDLDFAAHVENDRATTSLDAARRALDEAFERALATLRGASAAELDEPMPANAVMSGPRTRVVGAIVDHTAHHRGSLAVYARLLGKTPSMPYA